MSSTAGPGALYVGLTPMNHERAIARATPISESHVTAALRAGGGRSARRGLLSRLLVITAAASTLAGCGTKTVETSKCYFAGQSTSPEGAKSGPALPCLGKGDARLPALLDDSCQKLVEVTGDPTERPASGTLPPSCCYKVEAEEKTCEVGRPMLVGDRPRVALLARGRDWSF